MGSDVRDRRAPRRAGHRPPAPADRRRPRVLLVAVISAALAVSACGPGAKSSGKSPGTGGTASSTPAARPTPSLSVVSAGGTASTSTGGSASASAAQVSYSSPVRLELTDGTFTSVQVTATDGGTPLEGDISGDKTSWVSQSAPRPASSYRVSAAVADVDGRASTVTTTFTVASVPDDKRISFSVTPDDGTTVGIGQPVVVRFTTPITRRADVEKVMTVDARTPSGEQVAGSWHWLGATEAHWRPEEFWTPGTKVTLDMKLAGVQGSPSRFGRKDYSETFTIGASHVTRVDASAHTVKVYRDGALVDSWAGGTGRKGLETYSGTYIVLGKASEIRMDSCSARITCDKKDPDYYDEKEYWATRITASGTFLHAASWDGQLGRANVSHGCIHLSDDHAKDFYQHAVIGDVVVVTNTGRGPQERIATQDPGLIDWNLSWSAWKAGSALS